MLSSISLINYSYSVSPISYIRLSKYGIESRDIIDAKVALIILNIENLSKGLIL